MSTSALEQVVERPAELDEQGRQRRAHIVYPKGLLMDAIVNGTAIKALCGHLLVPGRGLTWAINANGKERCFIGTSWETIEEGTRP